MVKWKREEVPDHKFDYVDVREFEKPDCLSRFRYSWVFLIVLKSVLVYIGDLWTATALLLTDKWAGAINPKIPFEYSKWIFVCSIIASFILLTLEIKKANAVISSRDISFSLTNMVAYRYYTLMSYGHWCFFSAIRDRQKTIDKIAFFVYFGFKGWKRLLFCDGPRQVINFITLFSLFQDTNFSHNPNAYGTVYRKAAMGVMAFTVAIFIVSALMLLVSFILYLPLLCKIRGNLKEYCCHMIDKRITELLAQQRERRIKKTTKGPKSTVQPTLPAIEDTPPSMAKNYPVTPNYNPQDQHIAKNRPPVFPQSQSTPIPNSSYAPDNNNSGKRYPAPSGRQQSPQNKYPTKGSVSVPIPVTSYEVENMSPTRPTYRMDVPATSPQQKNTPYYANSAPYSPNSAPYSPNSAPYSPSQYNYDQDQYSINISPVTSPQGISYPMPGYNNPPYNNNVQASSQFYKYETSSDVTRMNKQNLQASSDVTRMNKQNLQASSASSITSSNNSKSSGGGASAQSNSAPLMGRYGQDRMNRRRHDNYILQGGAKKQ